MDRFNQDYRDLLKLLQSGFSGGSDALSTAAFQKMPALGAEGRKLMATTSADGGPLGPSFEHMHDP
jgi:hypothetical protein